MLLECRTLPQSLAAFLLTTPLFRHALTSYANVAAVPADAMAVCFCLSVGSVVYFYA